RRLERARRPLLIAGGGVVAAGAGSELLQLARRLAAPVITTVMGRGSVPEDDPVWHAVLPNKRATEGVIKEADVVLAVGCRFAARSTQGLLLTLSFTPDQPLIPLDLDATVIGRLYKPQLGIVGDAQDGLARLVHTLGPGRATSQWDRARLAELKQAA